jgi:hypothetical protein
MTIITGDAISHLQLAVWRGCLRLEKAGLKRRGRAAKKIVQDHFNMPKATYDQLIARVEQEMNK